MQFIPKNEKVYNAQGNVYIANYRKHMKKIQYK